MERSNLARLKALQAEGHECRLVSLNAFGDLLPLLKKSSIEHEALHYGTDKLGTFKELFRKLRRDDYDAVICTGHSLLVLLALSVRQRARQMLCIHFHHFGVKPLWFWKLYYWLAIKRFNHIFFNSSFIREEALALAPALAEVSSVLPNIYEFPVVNCEKRCEMKKKLGIKPDVMVVANAGWLIPRKRFDVFIDTAAVIKHKCSNTFFVIAGDGSEAGELRRRVDACGLQDSFKWLGWQDDMETVYGATDLVLFNTDWDAVARTPIEAGLRGVNVVCSEINGGLRDLFDHPPWILDRHDPGQLAEMVLRLLSDTEQQRGQVVEIRETIARKCSHYAHVQNIIERLSGDARNDTK
ncbi:MAG: glycosyltransferase family 4 protein [Desulfobulbus sp.]|nr:glycosyltransferase family 4 protein [Desulfobulbus sp.]